MAMDGIFTDELSYRIKQSRTMAQKLYLSSLTPIDLFMVYETRYRPALQFPLHITTFSKSDIAKIQKPFIGIRLEH
jgi:hypothetical protein